MTIAKVDATANDVPDEIQGFPTIKLFPAGNKSDPISYSGSRTVEDLVQFVKENGKHAVDAYEGKAAEDAKAEEPEKEELGEQAPAATENIKSKVSSVVEAVKTAVADSDDQAGERDEL